MATPVRRFFFGILAYFVIILVGTVGYCLIEGWSPLDSFFMSMITVATVGFGEIHPLSSAGRVFTVILVLFGAGAITYTFGTLTDYLLWGELQGVLGQRRMKRAIGLLKDHFVVCGFGEVGRQVCRELERKKRPFVIVDHATAAVKAAWSQGYLALEGDAGLDTVLKEAGLERSAGLVVATDDDATNLLVVLTARVLKADVPIAARANLEEVVGKLHRAGADRVMFPQSVVGRRLAQMLLHPEICDFLDVVSRDESLELLLENFRVPKGSALENKTLQEARIRELTGASVVGLKRPGEGITASIKAGTRLRAGDIVFALGTRGQVEDLGVLLEQPPL